MLKSYLSPSAYTSLRNEQAARLKARFVTPEWPADLIDWIERNFYLYDTGQPFRFNVCKYNLMARALDKALERNPDGTFRYRRVVWSWPKKSAKSSVIAAVIHLKASARPNAQIALMGHDQRQASSRIGFYLKRAILLGQKYHIPSCMGVEVPKLDAGTIRYPNGSRVEMLAVDPRGEAGGNHDDLVYSELWAWKHAAHQLMWAEMTISPTKFGYVQQWVDTYAGFVGDSPILEPLYDYGVTQGTRIWEDLEVYEHGDQLTVWVTQPLLDWQTPEYYASEEATLTPQQFLRLHRNQWVQSVDTFINRIYWDACKGDLPNLTYLVVGVDAAVKNDSFGITTVGRIGAKVYAKYSQKWTAPEGGTIDFDEPMRYLQDLCKNNRVVAIGYDPYELHWFMDTIRKSGLAPVYPIGQAGDQPKADKQLRDMIIKGDFVHDGNETLTEHIMNAAADISGKGENHLRMIKRHPDKKIDAAKAAAIATWLAMYLNIG